MTPNPQSAFVICVNARVSCAVLLGIAALTGGCMAAKKQPAISWKMASVVHPTIPPVRSVDASTLPEVTSVPELSLSAPPITFLAAHPVPPRPRTPVQPAPASDAEKQDGPLIVPQVTAQESASAQQEITASLSIAERNLASVHGKKLNATQVDMASKTKGFMDDAREAARSGDWARARSLAKKAEVLSEELARSF